MAELCHTAFEVATLGMCAAPLLWKTYVLIFQGNQYSCYTGMKYAFELNHCALNKGSHQSQTTP